LVQRPHGTETPGQTQRGDFIVALFLFDRPPGLATNLAAVGGGALIRNSKIWRPVGAR
jgi:hypothetical protein